MANTELAFLCTTLNQNALTPYTPWFETHTALIETNHMVDGRCTTQRAPADKTLLHVTQKR